MTTEQASTPTPASANFEKLKAKLRELFELDKADLDFGIYRVLRARHREIAEFLDKHLEKTVREALQSHGSLHQAQIGEDLRKAEQAAKDAGIAPEQSPRVLEIREKLKAGNDLDALADEVYSHLYTFFSRYYQEGDFLGLQRSTVRGREKYMIPYNGEEVKLVWANMDQYYIKSSELLRDYVFQIAPGAGTLLEAATTERFSIHFKLVEADTEKDNRKPSGKTTRAFALDDEKPFEVSREDAKGAKHESEILTIRFRYREHTAERNLQDKLNADTEKTLADNLPAKWKAVLFAPDPAYQGKDKKDTRTILQKHLRAYTARHQFDYFIHKDLGGFLRRELDFYIKNEVMYLDDIEESSAPKAEEYLSKIRALRRCALPVIQMLEQLENFQKKLWLKKKFVVETRYCMTLDRVPESLYPEIAANAAQWEEWERLYALSEMFDSREDAKNAKESQKGLFRGFAPSRDPEFLKANPYLMVDTRHFGREFTLKLLASVENLDEMLDGVCFHSENFQALQLMQERYREQVKCVYIDPPYNAPASEVLYKNDYLHSSWLALMQDRVSQSKTLLSAQAPYAIAIDDYEIVNLCSLLGQHFTNYDRHTVVVNHHPQGGMSNNLTRTHEYMIVLTPFGQDILRGKKKSGEVEYRSFMLSGPGENKSRSGRPNSFYAILIDDKRKKIVGFEQPPVGDNYPIDRTQEGYIRKYPINEAGEEKVWCRAYSSAEECLAKGEIILGDNGSLKLVVDIRNSRHSLMSNWTDSRYNAGPHGTALLANILGDREAFPYPKSIHTVRDSVEAMTWKLDEPLILDFFAGSGTTGHAVISLNREDKCRRKYVCVEMGAHFENVLVPRLKKVVYSIDWRDAKPLNRNTGISHAFKIVRLESYEDALNNLRLKRTPEQEAALRSAPEKARDQYLLGYFLDVESAGSASLLDLDQFRDPFAYQLKIATSSVGETVDTTIDLVETFNWLLGLKVKHIDSQKGFLTVTGEKRAGGRTLVIWRTLSDDPIADNKALEAFLSKIKVNPADTEFDYIYINGSHTLTDPHNKVHLIEEAFQRLMFDTPDFGMEA
ncbi:MAG: DNA methyltransferase [Pseudomonadota bacterium]